MLAALDRLNLTDTTLVMLTSDNGGTIDTNGPDTVNSGTVETNQGHLLNGVLRGGKGSPYEGGTRVPFIVRRPGRFQPGVSGELICHVDILASMAALTGQSLPEAAGPDNFNVLPALRGEKLKKPCRDHLVEQGDVLALRQGNLEAGSAGGRRTRPQETESASEPATGDLRFGHRPQRDQQRGQSAPGPRGGHDRASEAGARAGPQPAVMSHRT